MRRTEMKNYIYIDETAFDIPDNENDASHYGTPHSGNIPHSGRYEYGSGDNAYQRAQTFLTEYDRLHAEGKTEGEIVKYFRENVKGYENFTSTDLKARKSVYRAAAMEANIIRATRLKEHGCSNMEIGRKMGVNESVVRSWLSRKESTQNQKLQATADILKKSVDKKGPIDIGAGVELELGVTRTNFDTAVSILKEKGYNVYTIHVPQPNGGPNQKTTMKILAPEDTTWKDVITNTDKIKTITEYSSDGGLNYDSVKRPSFVSSDRIFVRYNDGTGSETDGSMKDGVIEIRRGVQDLTLGKGNYAQVRIGVDGTHFIKGMAMYSDDIPEGYDIIVNSNKKPGTTLKPTSKAEEGVFKMLKSDPDNPFGAVIKRGGQDFYEDKNGKYVKEGDDTYREATSKDENAKKYSLSPINRLKEEGDWDSYSKTLSSQMLSKQSLPLVKKQLEVSYAEKKAEFDEIMSVNNPVVKQKLLEGFASDCDSSAVDLKASALPRQSSRVILPLNCLKPTEIYAPTYKDGERVCLIRYPHGGIFEIPELVVNNKSLKAKKILGNTTDAVGIHQKVAEQLSGADFDGDSVIVIPVNDRVRLKTSPPLEGLKGFNTVEAYPKYPGMPEMSSKTKQLEMGKVSNLITDMTIKGATEEELTRAVKHSMVVIDAEKHHLNYKQSYDDNAIGALKAKYQERIDPETGKVRSGASTLISRASSKKDVNERVYNWKPDEDGKLTYRETGRTYVERKVMKDGTVKETTKLAKEETTWMADTDDARTLSSGYPVEEAYAKYANSLKALANNARKEQMAIKPIEVSKTAATLYKNEVESLEAKLTIALKNAPKERQAIIRANNTIKRKLQEDPAIINDNDKKKKIKQQAMTEARDHYGAKKALIDITDREWEAIQSHAIPTTTLKKILNNSDLDALKKRATPKVPNELSASKQAQIKAYQKSGLYSIEEIADILNVSTTSVSKYSK